MTQKSGWPAAGPARWLAWLVGIAALASVIVVARHFSEEQAFLRLLHRSHPWWIAGAVVLQALTYLSEAQIWRALAHRAGALLPIWKAYRLSFAKLFVDQALPSGGISGTVLYVQGLTRGGLRQDAALAGVAVGTFSYYGAYVVCLAVAVWIAAAGGHLNRALAWVVVPFALVATALSIAVLFECGGHHGRVTSALEHVPLLRRGLRLLHRADPAVARDPRLLMRALAWQAAIFALDAGTIWVLLLAVGVSVSAISVFSSYMFSSLFRTLAILPGGLGAFEAASVVMLGMAGVSVAEALAATLLFRGLSFWLPMLPGLLAARAVQAASRFPPSAAV